MSTSKQKRRSPLTNVTRTVGGAVTRIVEEASDVVDKAITVLPRPVRGVAEEGLDRGRELVSGANRTAATVRTELAKATDAVLTEKGRKKLVDRVEKRARGAVQQTLSSVLGTPTRNDVTRLRRRVKELEKRIAAIADDEK